MDTNTSTPSDNTAAAIACLTTQVEQLKQLLTTVGSGAGGPRPRTFQVEEAAQILKRAPYTVREWCRLGQCRATKAGRCGPHARWRIPAEEVDRLREEGLLPVDPARNQGSRWQAR